jgi:GNAT superfamily N-acetyltransferase
MRVAHQTYDQRVGEIRIRPARRDDAAFLALAMQEADRGNTGTGSWDVMFPGADEDRLRILAALASASQPSYVHWSTFLIAEIDDEPAGTVAGYVPGVMTADHFVAACHEVLGSDADQRLAERGAWSREYFAVSIPNDALRMEWVYTDPELRSRGVSSTLIAVLLQRARADRIMSAYVGTYIGNAPAISTYSRAGFEEFAECRHLDYQLRFKAPGLVFLRRTL